MDNDYKDGRHVVGQRQRERCLFNKKPVDNILDKEPP